MSAPLLQQQPPPQQHGKLSASAAPPRGHPAPDGPDSNPDPDPDPARSRRGKSSPFSQVQAGGGLDHHGPRN